MDNLREFREDELTNPHFFAIGGYGVLYIATTLAEGTTVVLKRLTIRDYDKEEIATAIRFRQEAELTGRLEHPNIIKVMAAN